MNEFRAVQESMLGEELLHVLLWTYAIVGGLFIIFSVAIFIQVYVKFKFRGMLSLLFLIIGTLFLNLAGRIMTGYVYHFTVITIVNIILLGILGGVFVFIIYRGNEINRAIFRQYKRRKQ